MKTCSFVLKMLYPSMGYGAKGPPFLMGGVCIAQRENMIESVSGELPPRSGEEIGDLTHRLGGTPEEDNSKTQLLSTVAQDLV